MHHRLHTGADLAVVLAGVGALAAAVTWAGGALSAALFAHFVGGRPLAGLVALGHLGDPAAAWHAAVGPPAAYWTCVTVTATAAGGLAWGAWRLSRRLVATTSARAPRNAGLATSAEARRVAGSRALLARSTLLRPSLGRPRPEDVGFRLGRCGSSWCWASVEDSMLLLGPPRSGKGTQIVIPMIVDAPGPVVTTSTRPDNLAVTAAARRHLGPVCVFDPQHLAGRPPSGSPRWSVLRGCAQPQTAMARAEALVPQAGSAGVENANFWRTQALGVVRGLLHAAALDSRPPADLYRWSHAAAGAKEAVAILAAHPQATAGWERALDAVIGADQRTRDSVWAMVANTFAPLADPAVLAEVSPHPDNTLDPDSFLAANGTLYLLGTATGASATATLVAALVEDMVDAARRLAARSPSQRLDPPLTVVLDEAANYPLGSLPALMSDGSGSGICTLAVLQSLAQARDRWGKDAAGAIWDAAIVKLVLGGSANADDLADLSRLIGDHDVREWSETRAGAAMATSTSSSLRRRPIMEPADLRRLPLEHGLLLLRSAAPIMIRLTPWTARRDAAQLAASRAQFEHPECDSA